MRNKSIDAFRGLIMIFMAIDHVSYFVLDVHFYEGYDYIMTHSSIYSFLTRFISHLCAPGFFLAMGYGMGKKFQRDQVFTLSFAKRGIFLILLQFTLINMIWDIEVIYYGVIFQLGFTMIFMNFLLPLIKKYGLLIGSMCIICSQVLISQTLPMNFMTKLFIQPGLIYNHYILYVTLPWLGLTLIGASLSYKKKIPYIKIGSLLIVCFFFVRSLNGFGNTHPYYDLQSFFNLTKYPPSLVFLLLTSGINFIIIGLFSVYGQNTYLVTLGKNPLVFYIAHLALYRFISMYYHTQSYWIMYLVWGLSLIPLYLICKFVKPKQWIQHIK